MLDFIAKINGYVNNVVWGVPALVLLIGTGVLVTIRTRFFQFSRFGLAMKETVGGIFKKEATTTTDKRSISQFQALCSALSATIGTGNIAGVAYAITMGGPGAVFWMWIAALVGMGTHYAEVVLGLYYRRKNADGEWCGGAMYYLRDGLGSKHNMKTVGRVLSILFSCFAMLASFGIGNMSQMVSIKESVQSLGSITGNLTADSIIIGAVVAVLAMLVIIGGLKRLAAANEKIVPFMAVFYIIGSVIVICMNIENLGAAFTSIFKGAFSLKSAAGGIGGAVIAQAITWGFKRGVFSNEAGLGSSVIVHSTADVREPAKQGTWGIFEVFFDTIIICSLTALVVLTSGVVDLETGASISGVTKLGLATEAFTNSFGVYGGILMAVAVSLFAFSTVLGWSFYGVKSWEYLFGIKYIMIYKVIFVVFVVLGATVDAGLAIDLSDTFNGLMAIPNLIGVLALSGTVVKITKNYLRRQSGKFDVMPMLSYREEKKKKRSRG
ncbi:MAG: alanine:cation symporter family protein [Clostridiales bacterium]|nr:alanine:cation symporter family protein [Clostridiales bacterium]